MILLDTNVVSEPLKTSPDPSVLRWLDAQSVETLYRPAIGVAELLFGIAALPDGQRRNRLQARFDQDVLPLFEGRILAFDSSAAGAYATLLSRARAQGKTIANVDGYIAAIAASHDLTIATCDTSPFEAAGVPVINPWLA